MVLSLICLETGRILTSGSSLNPQVIHGHDVMTRIQYAKTPQGRDEMAALVYLPPVMHAFVGTDISAGLVLCPDFFDDDKSILFIDMGTNGEICPADPAGQGRG